MKTELRNLARKMRLEGCSLKEISRLLKVTPSSVSLWVKGIVLTEDQRSNLNCRIVENGRKLGKVYGKVLKNKFDIKSIEFKKNGYEK